jgi:hypothetical protein
VLWTLAAAALLQGGLLLALPGMPWLVDPNYGGNLDSLRHRIAATRQAPLVVACFGSSRTYHGLNGTLASRILTEETGNPVVVHNFGRQGGGCVTSLLYLRRLLDDGVRPDLVVLEVLPFYFGKADPLVEVTSSFHSTASLRYAELPLLRRYSGGHRELSRLRWQGERLLPAYSHRREILLRVAPQLITFNERFLFLPGRDASGWMPLHGECKELTRTAQTRAMLTDWVTPNSRKVYRDGASANALREALALCRARGIPAAVLLMPEGPMMRSVYPPRHWAEFQALVKEICRDGGAPFVNARLWIDTTEFHDSHHLLAEGANHFTERLAREALPSLLIPTPSGERPALQSVRRGQAPRTARPPWAANH